VEVVGFCFQLANQVFVAFSSSDFQPMLQAFLDAIAMGGGRLFQAFLTVSVHYGHLL
jgi:hypothetical protein